MDAVVCPIPGLGGLCGLIGQGVAPVDDLDPGDVVAKALLEALRQPHPFDGYAPQPDVAARESCSLFEGVVCKTVVELFLGSPAYVRSRLRGASKWGHGSLSVSRSLRVDGFRKRSEERLLAVACDSLLRNGGLYACDRVALHRMVVRACKAGERLSFPFDMLEIDFCRGFEGVIGLSVTAEGPGGYAERLPTLVLEL